MYENNATQNERLWRGKVTSIMSVSIDALTPDELCREIAAHLGYTNIRMAIMPGQVRERLVGDYSPTVVTAIPNWPEDKGAALDLCMVLASEQQWALELIIHEDRSVSASFHVDYSPRARAGSDGSVALALTRLALAALRLEQRNS